MPKTVQKSKISEWKGLDKLNTVIHEMNCIFREISKDDFGIDGEIEMVVPKITGDGFETTGGIIKVQVKSGRSYVVSNTEEYFKTPVRKDDLIDWNSATFPVIFVVYHPEDDKLYWKEIKSYIKSTPNVFQPPLSISFVKGDDELTHDCYDRIFQLTKISPPRVSFDQKERLFSNLLLVKRTPKFIYYAPTSVRNAKVIRETLRESKQKAAPFLVKDGTLFALADLRAPQSVLRPYCDADAAEEMRSAHWIEEHRADFVFLLNQLLGIHLRACGLWYSRDFRRNYFPKPLTGKERKLNWYNVRTSRHAPARTVAKYHQYGRDRFWRHQAVNLQFKQIGTAWYLQVNPKSFYTHDGETPYDNEKVGPLTTTIRAKEHNNHVLNHVLFWSDVLSQQQPIIDVQLFNRSMMIIEKEPFSGIAGFVITGDTDNYDEGDALQLDFSTMLLSETHTKHHDWDDDEEEDDDEHQD